MPPAPRNFRSVNPNKQYKTVGPQMTALAGLHAKLLLRRYILPESRMKRTVIINQS